MHSIRRSCHAALLDSKALYSLAHGPRRAFSHSAVYRRGALPAYLEASSPELSQALFEVNSKVLLPRHLTPEQEKLVYKPENRMKLEQEPIEITLGDVTLPLEHIDRNKDVPPYREQFRKILKQSQTPEDWENVVRVLEGYTNANLHLPPGHMVMAVRYLSNAGMQHLILKALQRAKVTGLRLEQFDLITIVLRSVRDKAWRAHWTKEELKKALSMAEQVVELMDSKEHAGKLTHHPHLDYRSHPAVVSVPLEMAAELAYRHDGDTEKVGKYALRLMNALKQHEFLASDMQKIEEASAKTEADFNRGFLQANACARLHEQLYRVIPIWNGLSTARTVLDANMPMADDAERVQRQLRELLRKGAEALERLRIRKGSEIASAGPNSYSEYVKNAIEACEEDEAEDEE